jgi:hypothetical protein
MEITGSGNTIGSKVAGSLGSQRVCPVWTFFIPQSPQYHPLEQIQFLHENRRAFPPNGLPVRFTRAGIQDRIPFGEGSRIDPSKG